MRFAIKSVRGRNGKSWKLEYRLNGERFRLRFKTKELAEAEQERIEKQIDDGGSAWLALSAAARIELMTVLREIQGAGKTLRGVWEEYKRRTAGKDLIPKSLNEAFDQFMKEREKLNLSKRHLRCFQSYVGRFVFPRATQQVPEIVRQDIVDYLKPYKNATFNTYRNYLNIFFVWCKELKFIDENPVDSVGSINTRRMDKDKPPGVLHYDECVALFKAALELDPGMIRYVATSLQAGLRPEREAPGLHPSDITDRIHVRGKTAKDRQQRYVEIIPALKEWLALPMQAPLQGPQIGDYPIKNLRRRFDAIRARAGLIKLEYRTRPKKRGQGVAKVSYKITETNWPQDCMRHTFASAYYAVYGADKTIEALGHGDYDMLFGHYRRLMTKEEGLKILSITPAVCLGLDQQPQKTRTATSGATPRLEIPAPQNTQTASV